jgi:hypothetical protein
MLDFISSSFTPVYVPSKSIRVRRLAFNPSPIAFHSLRCHWAYFALATDRAGHSPKELGDCFRDSAQARVPILCHPRVLVWGACACMIQSFCHLPMSLLRNRIHRNLDHPIARRHSHRYSIRFPLAYMHAVPVTATSCPSSRAPNPRSKAGYRALWLNRSHQAGPATHDSGFWTDNPLCCPETSRAGAVRTRR